MTFVPVFSRFSSKFLITSGIQISVYELAITVFCSFNGTDAREPLLEKYVATIFLPMLYGSLNFVSGSSFLNSQTEEFVLICGSNW